MQRREFLRTAAGAAMLLGAGCAGPKTAKVPQDADAGPLAGIQIIDPHAHPDMDYEGAHWTDRSASYQYMLGVHQAASSYSAVGDRVFRYKSLTGSPFQNTKAQIDWWLAGVVRQGRVRVVLKTADIAQRSGQDQPPGALFSIEGGDAFEGRLENVDAFHALGVRIVTLVHYRNNEIGDIMKAMTRHDPGPYRGGLSPFGRDVIGRMEELGMVVDVAHAHPTTFREILAVAGKPVIDSHTDVSPSQEGEDHGRMRTWREMELVAKNGGVTCTWPMPRKGSGRLTMLDWAREIAAMKRNLGIEHVGLGTDGGGGYRPMAEYHDERDLVKLAQAMDEVGLTRPDMAAYFGGNVLRVMRQTMG